MQRENQTNAADNAPDSKSSKIKIVTDEPPSEDALDFNSYSQKLAEIIRNSTPRFSIGIFGGWGTGKTTLMLMTKEILDSDEKIVTVWFDAWRYEREENLAVIPFLRTVKLTLDASEKFKVGNWNIVKNGVLRSATAFIKSTKVSYGIKDLVSVETDFGKVADSLKGDGSVGDDKNTIYYHVTGFLEKALQELRKQDTDYRIVIFIDDLDRCNPEKALEVLESIKSFFDVEGIIYVIGMDSETINSLVKKKYGEEYAIKGLDYLQKIVQLPFQIPTWKEVDISNSISKIISKGLEGSELAEEFEKNKELIVRAIKLNPREVKRFINNIILAKAVFDKPINELIAIRALDFRRDWSRFLELITPDSKREKFLDIYKELKKEGRSITNTDELDRYIKEISETNQIQSTDIFEIYQELIKQGKDLINFLDVGADDILFGIKKMEEYRRALAAVKIRSIEKEPIEITGTRKALIIGASDYDHLLHLDFCKNNGDVTYRLLKTLGYQITDSHKLIGHVTYESMREAIIDFFIDVNNKAEDTLLFYYSGHGIPDIDGDMYLASSEIDPHAPYKRGFSFNELTKMIQRSLSIRIVTILDCCYSGSAKLSKGYEEDAAAKLGTAAINDKSYVLQQGEGKCLLAASQAAQEAYALKEGDHSIFTYYVLQGLRGNEKSVDIEGNVTPYSLGRYIYRSILNLPEVKRPKQKPIIKVEGSGDIILASFPALVKSYVGRQ